MRMNPTDSRRGGEKLKILDRYKREVQERGVVVVVVVLWGAGKGKMSDRIRANFGSMGGSRTDVCSISEQCYLQKGGEVMVMEGKNGGVEMK